MKKCRNLLIIVLSFMLFSVPVFAGVSSDSNPVDNKAYYISFTRAGVDYIYTGDFVVYDTSDTFILKGYTKYMYSDGEWVNKGSLANQIRFTLDTTYSNFVTNNDLVYSYAVSAGIFSNDGDSGDIDDGEIIPPTSAQIVVDWTDFTNLIVRNLGMITTVGCLVLSLILSPVLVKKLYRLVRP